MYDLNRPHRRIMSHTSATLIIQDGVIYEFGSGKQIGLVGDAGSILVAKSQGHFMCQFDGATFPTREGLEKWVFERHRDKLIGSLSMKNPDLSKRGLNPTEELLQKEAVAVVDAQLKGVAKASEPVVPVAESVAPQQAKKSIPKWKTPVKK